MTTREKSILLISPNPWGARKVSKHHYAELLANVGYQVYFLNPPKFRDELRTEVIINNSEMPNLTIIDIYQNIIFYHLRFKWKFLYSLLIRFSIAKINKINGCAYDILWSFESNLYSDLRLFNAKYRIFHAVDNLINNWQKKPSKSVNLNIAVSQSILDSINAEGIDKILLGHGLSSHFKHFGLQKLAELIDFKSVNTLKSKIKIGFSGNLLRSNLDCEFITKCIKKYTDYEFVLLGNFEFDHSNLGATNNEQINSFVDFLKESGNVKLLGVIDAAAMPTILNSCDILLVPIIKTAYYDGSNSHKILEYLCTGKVIVSYYVEFYSNSDLIQMTSNDDNNSESLLKLLDDVLLDLPYYNNAELMKLRIQFALENTYENNLFRILKKIDEIS